MLEVSGGALSSEQVAEVLGISRQAVDKRRSSNQLLALTQGRRGYSYPGFQFEDGKTIRALEDVLAQLKSLDPWMQMVFFTSANERLGGKTPIKSLQKGFVEKVTQAASRWRSMIDMPGEHPLPHPELHVVSLNILDLSAPAQHLQNSSQNHDRRRRAPG